MVAVEVWNRGLETEARRAGGRLRGAGAREGRGLGGCRRRGRAPGPRGWRRGDPIPALPDLGAGSSLLWKVYTFFTWLPAAQAPRDLRLGWVGGGGVASWGEDIHRRRLQWESSASPPPGVSRGENCPVCPHSPNSPLSFSFQLILNGLKQVPARD